MRGTDAVCLLDWGSEKGSDAKTPERELQFQLALELSPVYTIQLIHPDLLGWAGHGDLQLCR